MGKFYLQTNFMQTVSKINKFKYVGFKSNYKVTGIQINTFIGQ